MRKLLTFAVALGLSPTLWAQTCNTTCAKACGPIQDVGKAAFQQCEGKCLTKCAKCDPLIGAVYPKYYVLGLVYAPPGCTSTTAQPCTTQSTVDYLAGSAMGTKVSSEKSFQSGQSLKLDLSFGDSDAKAFGSGSGGVGGSFGTTNTTTDTDAQTVTKGETLDIKATGNGDGIDHGQDAFILLLNPAVAIKQNQVFNTDELCVPTGQDNWYVGLNSALGSGQLLYYTVFASELRNPASMRPLVAQQFQALNFTNDDFQAILALDPFANGATAIDGTRFLPTTYAFPYQPPLAASDCNNNGVCSCIAMADSIKNETLTENSHAYKTEEKVGITSSLNVNLGILKLGASTEKTWTWSTGSTTANTTDDSQTATATVVCPSSHYQGPATEMGIFWDDLYGSFLFVPTVIGSPQVTTLAQGDLIDASGKPARHVKITLSAGGKTYHTYTGNEGDYVFFVPAGTVKLQPSTKGQINAKGIQQTVNVGSSEKLQLRMP